MSIYVCVCGKAIQSCPAFCNLMDPSPPGSSVHGILQARILEWVALPSFRGSSWPRDWTHISCDSCIAGMLIIAEQLQKPMSIYLSICVSMYVFIHTYTHTHTHTHIWVFQVTQMIKNILSLPENHVWSLGQEDPLENGMVTHSSILACRISWTEEPGRLQSMGSQIAGQDWVTNTHTHTHTHTPACLCETMNVLVHACECMCFEFEFEGKSVRV